MNSITKISKLIMKQYFSKEKVFWKMKFYKKLKCFRKKSKQRHLKQLMLRMELSDEGSIKIINFNEKSNYFKQ